MPLVFVLVSLRNLVGDFRDAGDDRTDNMQSIPVVFGFTKNQQWAFYGHVTFVLVTTYIWFQHSFLDPAWMIPLMILQVISYPITPRTSNPKYLNFYE